MSSEETFYEKEKERLMKEVAKTVEEIALTINNINRSQEGTITLARDKVTGETNMWKHLRDVGEAKAKERADELAASTSLVPETPVHGFKSDFDRTLKVRQCLPRKKTGAFGTILVYNCDYTLHGADEEISETDLVRSLSHQAAAAALRLILQRWWSCVWNWVGLGVRWWLGLDLMWGIKGQNREA